MAIDPLTLGLQAALTTGAEIYKIHKANQQIKLGKSIMDKNRLDPYKIPGAEREYVGMERQNYLSPTTAGMKYSENQLDAGLNQSLDNVIQSGGSQSDVLAAITGLSGVKQKGISQNAAYFDNVLNQNRASYGNALKSLAGFQDKEYQLNKLLPFQQNAAAAGALINAGNMNKMNGISGLSSGLTSLIPIGTTESQFGTTVPQNTTTPQAMAQRQGIAQQDMTQKAQLPVLPSGTVDYSKVTPDMFSMLTPAQLLELKKYQDAQKSQSPIGPFGNYQSPSYGSPVLTGND